MGIIGMSAFENRHADSADSAKADKKSFLMANCRL
jgi:hypothetical protein